MLRKDKVEVLGEVEIPTCLELEGVLELIEGLKSNSVKMDENSWVSLVENVDGDMSFVFNKTVYTETEEEYQERVRKASEVSPEDREIQEARAAMDRAINRYIALNKGREGVAVEVRSNPFPTYPPGTK